MILSTTLYRQLWVQGPQDPGAGLGARSPQRSLLLGLKIVLENTTVKILESEKHEFRYMLLAGVRENGESPTDTA